MPFLSNVICESLIYTITSMYFRLTVRCMINGFKCFISRIVISETVFESLLLCCIFLTHFILAEVYCGDYSTGLTTKYNMKDGFLLLGGCFF